MSSQTRGSAPSYRRVGLAIRGATTRTCFVSRHGTTIPVGESNGEAVYLRDEETGHFWSPTSSAVRRRAPYVTRHGFGYSVFEHVEDGITLDADGVRRARCGRQVLLLESRLTGLAGRDDCRQRAMSSGCSAICARNRHCTSRPRSIPGTPRCTREIRYNNEFANCVAFFDVDDTTRSVTCDRTEFIGRNGTLRDPAAMHRTRLSGKTGAALDPCAAIQVPFDLADGQEREIVFRLGAASSADAAACVDTRCRGSAAAHDALEAVVAHWQHTLTAVQITTPDVALNVLTNGWLVYQTIACRLWARSGYYQSGGAFGFRDQLQDVMALVHCRTGPRTCADRSLCEPSIHRRRCPALVASAVGARRAHALFGRLSLVAAGDLPLRAEHR